jgi:hypothetical protein
MLRSTIGKFCKICAAPLPSPQKAIFGPGGGVDAISKEIDPNNNRNADEIEGSR